MLEGRFWGLRGKFIIITSSCFNARVLVVPSREFILLGCVLRKSQNYLKLFQFRVLFEILLKMQSTYELLIFIKIFPLMFVIYLTERIFSVAGFWNSNEGILNAK